MDYWNQLLWMANLQIDFMLQEYYLFISVYVLEMTKCYAFVQFLYLRNDQFWKRP